MSSIDLLVKAAALSGCPCDICETCPEGHEAHTETCPAFAVDLDSPTALKELQAAGETCWRLTIEEEVRCGCKQ